MATPFPVSADPCVVYEPVFPVTKRVRPRLAKTRLPNEAGHERRARVGVNQTSPEYDVRFFLKTADIDVIDTFLYDRARLSERFEWTAPDPGAVAAEYVCEEWRKSVLYHNMSELTATFKRAFTFE